MFGVGGKSGRGYGSWAVSLGVAVVVTGLIFWAAVQLSRVQWVTEAGSKPGALTNGDPRIAAAEAEARRTWPDFVSLLGNRRPEQRFFVKAKFMDGRTGEWVWVAVDSMSGTTLAGSVANPPVKVRTVGQGTPVTVRRDDVCDWLVEAPGEQRGGFTIKALDAIERERGGAASR